MTETLFRVGGGVGLFLLGMGLLTDGLKGFAGDALRRALVRFTGTPYKAFASGALVTVMVQSSSATTVAVIGFVSAGMLSFPQAVGVVLGASLGTTGTGWIVAIFGLKISVGFYALPLVGVGAFLRLLAHGRWKALGLALSGFGLIFVGIDTLQHGMQAMAQIFDPSRLPSQGFLAHLLTMLVGVALSVVMQSSSAAVATVLTALHAGAVNIEQSASLVIGAAVGTTVTGALAAIGGTVAAKRTALAHVLFNLATGLIAIILLPLLLYGLRLGQEHLGLEPGATSLAAFHTLFIALGVALFLPGVSRFARLIERMLPEKTPTLALTRHLDETVLQVPAVALETTRRALSETACALFRILQQMLGGPGQGTDDSRRDLQAGLEGIQEFFARIPPVTEDAPISQLRVAQLHAIDHLARLQSHLDPPFGVRRMLGHEQLKPLVQLSREILARGVSGLEGKAPGDWVAALEQEASALAERRREERPAVLRQTAGAGRKPADALEALDAMRWLDRLGYHTWRICNYLGGDGQPEPRSGSERVIPGG
jgi:phosphate:Na+ symporter